MNSRFKTETQLRQELAGLWPMYESAKIEIERLRAELANSEKAFAAKMRRIEMALRAVLTMAREADRRRCAVSASNVAEICEAALAAKEEE